MDHVNKFFRIGRILEVDPDWVSSQNDLFRS